MVDLNADLGEGAGDDDALLAIVTSANVACGAHAGDPETMRAVSARARDRGVTVGAHVSYVDREHFGRRDLDVRPEMLRRQVAEQIAALRDAGADVRYLKPHGALYHRCATDEAAARAVVDAAEGLRILGFPGSALLRVAGERAVTEGFADRAYGPDGRLVPRGDPGAVLDREAAVAQAVRLAGEVASVCVHGDTPGAVELARDVRAALRRAGVELRPFA